MGELIPTINGLQDHFPKLDHLIKFGPVYNKIRATGNTAILFAIDRLPTQIPQATLEASLSAHIRDFNLTSTNCGSQSAEARWCVRHNTTLDHIAPFPAKELEVRGRGPIDFELTAVHAQAIQLSPCIVCIRRSAQTSGKRTERREANVAKGACWSVRVESVIKKL
jgi:hypothetical protein